tara:strand:- start:2390 stop:2869 length:480 start_codon:yes stop_codon:yes gene_type:complete
LKKIKKINSNNIISIIKFIDENFDEFYYFRDLGWNSTNIENQLNKNINFSLGYFQENNLVGLLIGDIIKFDQKKDLELYILFVSKNMRRNKIATEMLKYVDTNIINLSRIFIEVAETNINAIKFYEKNNFVFSNFRHNYYKINNININAKCYFKKLNYE